jgi:hypothetical protein
MPLPSGFARGDGVGRGAEECDSDHYAAGGRGAVTRRTRGMHEERDILSRCETESKRMKNGGDTDRIKRECANVRLSFRPVHAASQIGGAQSLKVWSLPGNVIRQKA